VNRRVPFRQQHLKLALESHGRGELQLAGALADPVDGALLIFLSPDSTTVETFVKRDPYVLNGLVKQWRIRPWTVVVGNKSA
jgi:hypothetical protein